MDKTNNAAKRQKIIWINQSKKMQLLSKIQLFVSRVNQAIHVVQSDLELSFWIRIMNPSGQGEPMNWHGKFCEAHTQCSQNLPCTAIKTRHQPSINNQTSCKNTLTKQSKFSVDLGVRVSLCLLHQRGDRQCSPEPRLRFWCRPLSCFGCVSLLCRHYFVTFSFRENQPHFQAGENELEIEAQSRHIERFNKINNKELHLNLPCKNRSAAVSFQSKV